MFWIGLYLTVGLVVAAAFSAVGDRLRSGPTDHGLVFAALAGLLWPVTLIGLAQLAVLAMLRNRVKK